MHLPSAIRTCVAGFIAAAALWGCSNANENAPALSTSAGHPANWLVAHRGAFQADAGQCALCHGSDLRDQNSTGSITKVSCSSGSFRGTTCHAKSPVLPHPPGVVPHPLPFTDPALHGLLAKNDLIFCQGCHAAANFGGAGSNPRFDVQLGTLVAPFSSGCEAAACHPALTAHPVPWYFGTRAGDKGHQSAGNLLNACPLCHGAQLGGGTGPACTSCHVALAPGAVPTPGTCFSCHQSPPAGTTFPNLAGAHAAHNALAQVADNCDTCHNGAGTGTTKHFNGVVDLAVLATYNAKEGVASFDAATGRCSNVSCHGGLATPDWKTGALVVATQCAACHVEGSAAGIPQANSFFSGQHHQHLVINSPPQACTDCHDLAKLGPFPPSHFSGLNTPGFELPARNTLLNSLVYDGANCTPGCHVKRAWF